MGALAKNFTLCFNILVAVADVSRARDSFVIAQCSGEAVHRSSIKLEQQM